MSKKIDPGVQKCIAALQAAKDDTEKMAALFLVTKIVKAPKLDSENRLALFNAIGFKFLLKLLNSPSTADCPEVLYKSVALSILTAFCAEPSIAECNEMLEAIPIFLRIIEGANESGDDEMLMVVNETYHCLKCVASTEKGSLSLVKSKAIQRLVNIYTKHDSDEAAEVIKYVAAKIGLKTWDGCPEAFNVLMDRVSLQFEADQSEQKFELCGIMATLIAASHVTSQNSENTFWPASVLKGLIDMLTSKLTDKQRNPALRLASVVLTTFGVDWIIRTSEDRNTANKFIVLLVHLSCIEIRMSLEDRTIDKILPKEEVIGSCYGIIETLVRFISGHHFENLDDKQREQVFTSLKGSSAAILGFVNIVRKESEKNPKFWDTKKKLLACASIRCLASLLAEESVSLKEDVYKQLPFVLALVSEDYQDAELNQNVESMALAEVGKSVEPLMPEILCTFLPALCHLTAAEKGVSILTDAKAEELLFKFINHNWSVYKNLKDLLEKKGRPRKEKKGKKLDPGSDLSEEELRSILFKLRGALNNACNIFINMTVLNPEFVATSGTFQQVMRWSFASLPTLANPEEELILLANMSALGLLLLLDVTKKSADAKSEGQKLSPEDEFQSSRLISGTDNTVFRFGQAVVRFVWDAHLPDESQSPASLEITSNYRAVWADIKEMWFLSLQTVGTLMEILPWLGDFCCESGFLDALIGNLAKAYKNRIDQSTLAAYEDFLCAALQGGEKASQIIKTKGAALAASHHLRTLKKALTPGEGEEKK